MAGAARAALGFPWFIGTADHGPYRVAPDLHRPAPELLRGANGGSFLSGQWPAKQAIIVHEGPVVAAFLGTARYGRPKAEESLERAVRTGDFDALAHLPGSFHVIVSTASGTHVYGDIAGLRRVFYAVVDGQLVFSDHALLLQRLMGAPVDEHWLAMWLACPGHRHLVDRRTPFQGVQVVAPGSALHIDPRGGSRVVAYWRVPDDDVPLATAVPAFGRQLSDSVTARVGSVDRVSCDFSGGLDSSTLAFLAARGLRPGGSLLALTQPARSPTNDDPVWSTIAAASLPAASLPAAARQVKFDEAEWPYPYGELDSMPLLDEPAPCYALMPWLRFTANVQRAHGCEMHFSGHGGDQVLLPPIAYLARTLRTRPLAAIAQFRGTLALHRGISATAFAQMLRPPSYQAWLTAAALGVVDAALNPPPSWGEPPRTPSWMSATAKQLVVDVLRTAAAGLDPLSPYPGQHASLDRVREVAGAQRLNRDALAGLGVRLELPFFDGDVVQTCLSTQSHERAEPTRVKPLLLDAMAGIVPAEVLARTTKASYQTDFCLGWRRHHREVQALFEDSRLEARGLIDGDAVRAALRPTLILDFLRLASLNGTLVAELWLRALERDQGSGVGAFGTGAVGAASAFGVAGALGPQR